MTVAYLVDSSLVEQVVEEEGSSEVAPLSADR